MKRFQEYINEQRQINEDGLRDTLLGSIVMKLLDTGLSWLGSASKWVADTFKDGVKGGFESITNIRNRDDIWYREARRIGYSGGIPKNEKEYISFTKNAFMNKKFSINERYNNIMEFSKSFNYSNSIILNLLIPAFTDRLKSHPNELEDACNKLREFGNNRNLKAEEKDVIERAITDWEEQINKKR